MWSHRIPWIILLFLLLWPPEATHNTIVLLSVSCKSSNVYCITILLATWRRYRFFYLLNLSLTSCKICDADSKIFLLPNRLSLPTHSTYLNGIHTKQICWEWRKNKLIKFNFKVIIDDIKVHRVSHFRFHYKHTNWSSWTRDRRLAPYKKLIKSENIYFFRTQAVSYERKETFFANHSVQ